MPLMPSYSLKIKPGDKLEKRLLSRVRSRFTISQQAQQERHPMWRRAEELMVGYVPESEADAVRRNKREVSGEPKYSTIILPYSFAMVMSAHTYWTSVFFARNPVHQYSGRHGETEMQVQALEALIAYQVEVGDMMAPYYLWMYDGGKYGIGVLGHYWCEEKIAFGQIVEADLQDGKGVQLYQTTQEIEAYKGNRVYNVSPYDFFPDPRVSITNFQLGEFVIVRKRLSWAKILERANEGYFINLDEIKKHCTKDEGKSEGSAALARPDFSQLEFEDYDILTDKKTKHPSGGIFYEAYVDLIPSEWGLGDYKGTQKWCITVTGDFGLVVGCSPLGYMHGKFPFDVLEPEVEAYGQYNRGIPQIIEPIQNTLDWLINSHFYNVRAAVNNQFILDPSKIVAKDAENSGPGFVWRLRPEAYGSDIKQMFYQVPVQDVTRTHIGDMATMMQFGERGLGVNDQMMGMLGGTNRKTATEVRTATGFGVNRQKTVCEYISASAFSPHSQKLVQTSQQMYDSTAKMRIVGDLMIDAGQGFLDVSPDMIAGFYNFVPVDGTLPIDRMALANLWKEIFGGLRMMPPQILQSYDWAKMFGWMATLAGLKNIHQMKVQVMPDQQVGAAAAAGNVVPINGPRGPSPVQPGNAASTAAGLPALTPPADGGLGGGGY